MPRIVYSLKFETQRQPGLPITEFIVPLDRDGGSPQAASASHQRATAARGCA